MAAGAVLERLSHDPSIPVDPHILNGGLIYDPGGRKANDHSWPRNEPASREGAPGEGQVNSGLLGVG
jgi:hypothetical protein